jgi:exodeoxyribonuclease V alpha subunit
MARKYEDLTAEFDFERNVFSNGAPEDRAIVGVLADGKTVVKGKARQGELETGLTYKFYGYWTEHPKYGRQFAFTSFTLAVPTGQRGTVAYLQRGPGIGRKRAMQIWDLFGADALEAIRTRPEEVAAKVSGLTPEKARKAAAYFQQHADLEKTTAELLDLFANRGMPRQTIERAIGHWGAKAAERIRQDPYVLMDKSLFQRIGFAIADRLYLELGHDPAAAARLGWCAWNALHRDTDGHTWRPLRFCADAITREVAGTDADWQAGIRWAVEHRKITLRQEGREKYVALFARAASEQSIAGAVHEAAVYVAATPGDWPATITAAPEGERGPSRHQAEAVERATAGYVGILAGRPGTGKTYSIAAQIQALGGARIMVAAPTGKAAVRITESLAKAGVAGMKARTLHSLLKMGPDEPPEYDRDNPLPFDYLFVDEASMIDATMMGHVLEARPERGRILFCGDPGQLAPVGHGAPLRDLMAAGLPCGMLTEIQRNSGRGVVCCKEIAELHTFTPSPKIDLEAGENFGWIEAASPEHQIERLKGVLERLANRGTDVIGDAQVITAVNKKSPLSRKALNDLLQKFLNPNGDQVQGNPFRVGDKIVCTENGQVPAEGPQPEADPEGRIRVCNGEQARVVAVAPRYTIATMEAQQRKIRIPHGDIGGGDRDEDSENENSEETGCKWQLAYAITLHKAQGSDWPIVITMIDGFPGALRLCKREWPYTAFSRFKRLLFGIGRLVTARAMCRTSGLGDRKTFLAETIVALGAAGLAQAWEQELLEV